MAGPSGSHGLKSDDICTILADSDDSGSSINFSSSAESVIDYTQEGVPDDEGEDNNDDVTLTPDNDVQWAWRVIQSAYKSQKLPFTGQRGPQKNFTSVLDAFLLFFDDTLIDLIVRETNKYADTCTQGCSLKPRSCMRKWQPVTADEIYVVLGLLMLTGIVQKPTLKSYFSRDAFIETAIFPQTMTQDRFELILKCLHFVDNSTKETYTGPAKLFKIQPVLDILNQNFQSAYFPTYNISVDESLTLWKGRLGFKQYIPLKASKFGIKTFELCKSSTGYLWNFNVYTGAVPDNLKNSKIVVKLVEPLMNKGYSLWMDNYYNSPSLAGLLRDNGVNVAGTLRVNRKNVPAAVKNKKLKKEETIAAESNGVMVMKWKDKRDVSFISTFHDNSMETKTVRGTDVTKPKCIKEYNVLMGGVDLKDQILQPYLLERKRAKKWYVKFFKQLLNVAVHNSYVIYNSKIKTHHLTYRLDLLKALILTHRPQVLSPAGPGRPSTNPPLARLLGKHFIEKIPPTGKMQNHKDDVLFAQHHRREKKQYYCALTAK